MAQLLPSTVVLVIINYNTITTNKSRRGGRTSDFKLKKKRGRANSNKVKKILKKPFRVIANTTVLYWHSVSCHLINADTGSAEK